MVRCFNNLPFVSELLFGLCEVLPNKFATLQEGPKLGKLWSFSVIAEVGPKARKAVHPQVL